EKWTFLLMDLNAAEQDKSASFDCSHNVSNYYYIQWYKQTQSSGLKLLGYLSTDTPNLEPEYKESKKIQMDGDARENKKAFLTINSLSSSDSAVYFCASIKCMYGGNGVFKNAFTPLWGLSLISFSSMSFTDPQKEIRGPVVEVLPPSEAELCKKKKKDNVTLLCVAKNFYPDHVYVSWEIDNDVKREKTKDVPIEKDGNYIISSRLRVPKKDWKSGKKFTCIVYYYNGTGYEPFQDSISGVKVIPCPSYSTTAQGLFQNNQELPDHVYDCFVASCLVGLILTFFWCITFKWHLHTGLFIKIAFLYIYIYSEMFGVQLCPKEPNTEVRKPKVKVLPPSPKEPCWVRRNSVTLVCVATDFYPDHVTVSWKINGEKQSTGVGTGVAQRVNKSYSISSQLRVKMSTWQNPINTFSCSVIFYNGTHYIPVTDTINGKKGGYSKKKKKEQKRNCCLKSMCCDSSLFLIFPGSLGELHMK
uniref:Ig-like domain-containing protein n=1 Tax=Denticeps clupeoides TaxID=299321 RepID=A0AAY4AIS8_9TELE